MAENMRYVLWGSAGHAKVLASIIAMRGDRVVALFDNSPQAASVLKGVSLYIGKDEFASWIVKRKWRYEEHRITMQDDPNRPIRIMCLSR